MITIFCIEPPQSARHHSAFAISLLLHCAVLLFVVPGFYYSHPDSPKRKPYSRPFQFVRLQLSPPVRSNESPGIGQDAGVAWHPLRLPRAHRRIAKQTLIRPDVPPDVVLKHEIPLATAVLWAQMPLPSPPRVVTPPNETPKPQQSLPVRLSLVPPNRESHIADLKMAPALLTSAPALVIPPSATAPLQTMAPDAGNQLPQTVSEDAADPTPTHLIALPEIPVRIQSLLVIPPVNQVAAASEDAGGGSNANLHTEPLPAGGNGEATAAGSAPAKLTRISLPKDGKFGVVVTGSSASEAFPESQGLLSGNVVYTVYLHIGIRKNWVLQYCLPKDAQQASSDENNTVIDAPWPFLILRPDSLSTLNIDYVMVHGIINSAGRFEKLALVYPEDLPVEAMLIGALRNWSFRPAMRDGQAIAVEALLVVPRQAE